MENRVLKIAILDLYNGEVNQGMRCIREIIQEFKSAFDTPVIVQEFDIRGKSEVADLSFDAYISSGGPGSPIDSEGSEWERRYFNLMDGIITHNAENPESQKQVFLICHSFQLFCRYYELGNVSLRKSTSFGVMPVHMTWTGITEPFFQGLKNTFWAVDSRDWQVTDPDIKKLRSMGGEVLCIEKYRPHIKLERCLMAVRFNDAIFGTQFHPEADSSGMLYHLKTEDKRKQVIENFGEEKYLSMIDHLDDPEKIVLTHNTILPLFLKGALDILTRNEYKESLSI
jgi:homoserine O-succinyltransferase